MEVDVLNMSYGIVVKLPTAMVHHREIDYVGKQVDVASRYLARTKKKKNRNSFSVSSIMYCKNPQTCCVEPVMAMVVHTVWQSASRRPLPGSA